LFAAGQSIGSYRILQKIGTGGMGAVYLCEHPLIGKKVALKVIHRELASNKEVVQRFFQEAKAVTKIGNEHIVEIHDFGQTSEGDHFYIMEYLEGQNLATVLSNERVFDVMRALHVGAQIAAALAAAHAAGVIHRDLKPDNVMLTLRLGDPNFVVLLDFGLAKMFAGGTSAVKTAAGVLLGTPQYMSPEACESKGNLDHRTDIYALGVLLFQMMTGVLPFDGETMGEVLVKQVTQLPPPPRAYNPSIPPSVEQILLRCLAKNVDARFPTMLALREALLDPEVYLRNSPPMAPARSLAPGEAKVDAKTVMAYAAQEQRTKLGVQTGPQPALPLAAPPPSLPGNAGAKTVVAAPGAVQPRAQPPQAPEMAGPAQPKMNTMRIATPVGYSSHPPRKMWPFVLVLALLLGLGGGAFAVAWFGRQDVAATEAEAPDAGSPVVAPLPPPEDSAPTEPPGTEPPGTEPPSPTDTKDAATATGSATAPAASSAVIVIDSTPQGADVVGSDGASLGKTPVTVSLPISDLPLDFELKLAGYKKKTKQIIVTGNTVVNVLLDRVPPATSGGKGGKSRKRGPSDLMRPDDL
jgi:tRNA A-37 threonylcarbamoyl transferase component Bud32